MRYIASNAKDKSDSSWILRAGIWTSGALQYDLTGLTKGVQYDLQVRALNADGKGLWSDVFNGHTTPLPPHPPANLAVKPRDLGLGVVWNEPAFPGGVPITHYDVRHIESDATPTEKDSDTNWTTHLGVGTASGDMFTYNIPNLTNGVSYDVQALATNENFTGDWSDTVVATPNVQNVNPAFPTTEDGMRSVLEDAEVGDDVGSRWPPATSTATR